MAYNLVRNFQVDTQSAQERPKIQSHTHLYSFESLKTLRLEWIAVAGRIVNASGQKVLKLAQNERRQATYSHLIDQLDDLAAAA